MKNLIIRALTGIIFVIVLVGGICLHPIGFFLLFSIITGLTIWEFSGLLNHSEHIKINRIMNVVGGIFLFAATFAYTNGYVDNKIFLPYILFIMLILIGELYYKSENPINNWGASFFTQAYCAGSFSILNYIGTSSDSSGSFSYSPLFILSLFVFVWLDDTGAYLFGSKFGKHRLFERISPKKSWEGFFGGLGVSLLSSQIFAWFAPEVSWYNWLGLSATIVIFGTWGDLVESLLKRTLKVKDSGNVLPGHGGMLDRFDSVIMAIPASFVYIQLFIRN